MIYGYIRVSTNYQKIDRQYDEIINFGVRKSNIYIDKESGKNFNRINYKKLIKKIKKNDLIVVKSIDRLGRNYKMILQEWAYITNTVGADIKVLDMPLLDTRIKDDNLVGKFISDIVLQILSFVAENDRINIKIRQSEGIKIAKKNGVIFGRPKKNLPIITNEIIDKYLNKEINISYAIEQINVSKGTFYKLINQRKVSINDNS